jgi:transcriptional regulator with XRE-family HTH domain
MLYPNIAAERAKRGMSLDALAHELGVTRKTVYNWEQNGRIPQSALTKMADLFQTSADYLLETPSN